MSKNSGPYQTHNNTDDDLENFELLRDKGDRSSAIDGIDMRTENDRRCVAVPLGYISDPDLFL